MASAEQQSGLLNIQPLVDSIPALIHTATPDGHLDYFNKPWLDYLGATLDDVTGWKWRAFIHPEDVDGIVAKWRACLATGEIFEYETRVRRANGEYRWMFHRKVPLRDADDNILKWYGSSLDIENIKRAEALLSAEKRLLEMTATDVTLERILNVLCLFIEEQRSGTLASVLLLNPDGVYLCFAAGPSIPNEWKQQMEMLPIGPCAGSCGTAAYMRSPVIVPDIATDPLWEVPEHRTSALKHGLRASWSSPVLSSEGKVLGTFCMYYREPRSPEAQDLELIESATHLVGLAIERDRTKQALRRSEAYLTEAQRLSHTGSFGWRPDTGEIFWSDETFRIFQCDPSTKPTAAFVLSQVHPEDRDLVQHQIDRASRDGEGFDFEHRLQLPDGSIKSVRVTAQASRDSLGNLGFVGAVTDVSEQRQAETMVREREGELQENKAKLEEAQRVAHVGYWEWDLRTDHVTWSDETYRIYGLHPQERPMDLTTIRESIYPEDREFVFRQAAEAIQGEVRADVEHRIVRPGGEIRVVHSQGDLKRDAAGRPWQMFGTAQDITDRKAAEERIRGQEAELRQIVDIVPQLIAVYGPNRERLYANRTALDYLGVSPDEWRHKSFAASAHPDDSERLKTFTDRALSSGAADELELRLRKRDGSYRWFLARFNPLRDEQGRIIRWYYTGTDIEDRKQAEDRLRRENVALREEIDKASMFEEIVGTSPALQAVLLRISKVAPSDSTVLITGETGTGKELVARAIHRRSNRASRVFVSVNCAAIPRDLIASELFGHEKGAFTGATLQRLGRFELANGGTLFLDEVGELPAETQIALLRVLQEHAFERVGGTRRIRADVRVIAATNRDLQAAISAGSFRSDLFYRLHVFPIEIPALRERKEDIRLLVEYFIDRYARKSGKKITTVDKKTLRLLESYYWPGNIRELQNVIERSVILCETDNFSVDESWLSQKPPETKAENQLYLSEKVSAQEKEIIETALRECQGRVFGPSGAAAKLGIARSTLESKIRSLKINKHRFKG
jgi:PAS domain S-box-containing protein